MQCHQDEVDWTISAIGAFGERPSSLFFDLFAPLSSDRRHAQDVSPQTIPAKLTAVLGGHSGEDNIKPRCL